MPGSTPVEERESPVSSAVAAAGTQVRAWTSLARFRRFLGSRVAWAAAIVVACAAAFAWGLSPMTVALPFFVLLSICAVSDLVRVNRLLSGHFSRAAERAAELEAIVAIDALPLEEQDALRRVRDDARRTAELASACAALVAIPFLSRVTDDIPRPELSRRESRRLPQELLGSNLGPVLDLSHGGARVHLTRRRSVRGAVQLELDLDSQSVSLPAEVVWTSAGSGRREVGLRFNRLSKEQSNAITRICMQHRKCTELVG